MANSDPRHFPYDEKLNQFNQSIYKILDDLTNPYKNQYLCPICGA